jgi:hypothetical protein
VGHPDPTPVETVEAPGEGTELSADLVEARALEFVSEWRDARLQADPQLSRLEVDRPVVETWFDPESHLNEHYVTVEFDQRYERGLYPEHGVVHLQLWFGDDFRVAQETMFDTVPGWDQADPWYRMDGDGPAAREAAREVWRQLDVDGGSFTTMLSELGTDPRVTAPLAFAVLDGADLACRRTDEWEDCGGTWTDFVDPHEDAGFDDACLRRSLAIWALQRGQLSEDDVAALAPQLQAVMQLPAPESTLQSLAMQLSESLASSDRHAMLRRFAEARRGDEDLTRDWYRIVEDRWFDGLSDEQLLDLYDRGLHPAITHLDVDRHEAQWLAALDDEDVASSIRHGLLQGLLDVDEPAVNMALGRAALDDNCGLAMDAATLLAERGLDAWLPSKPINDHPSEYARALCMLSHADADERRAAIWADFVAPASGELPWTATYESEFEEDGATTPLPLTRDTVASFTFPLVGTDLSCELLEASQDAFTCEADSATIGFARGPDGSFYVTRVAEFWGDCGC